MTEILSKWRKTQQKPNQKVAMYTCLSGALYKDGHIYMLLVLN